MIHLKLEVKKLTQKDAIDILSWKYEKPYDFYNAMLTPDAMLELLGPSYYAVKNEQNQLVGFFCSGKAARTEAGYAVDAYSEDCIDIGIGMKPELTGKGYGTAFFKLGIEFISENHSSKPLRLTVAQFNKRAIRLYEKFGFVKEKEFQDEIELITMKKESIY